MSIDKEKNPGLVKWTFNNTNPFYPDSTEMVWNISFPDCPVKVTGLLDYDPKHDLVMVTHHRNRRR